MSNSETKIGLALGGGATLGAVHVGVLKALEELSIEISCISGTSIGAYVAALYACGVKPADIEREITGLDWLNISSFSLLTLRLGLLTNDKLGSSIKQLVGDVQIEDAKIPLAIIATDIGQGKKVVLTQGPLATAVMASACMPGIFAPIEIGDRLLVDGGLVENVPVSPLPELGAEMTIAVDLAKGRGFEKPDDIVDVLINSIDVAIDNATRIQTSAADVLIVPDLAAFSRTDTGQSAKLIREGHECGLAALRDMDI